MNLTTQGWFKQVKSLAIAGLGAAIAVVAENVSGMNFGIYTPLVVAAASVAVNAAKTWLEEQRLLPK